MLNKRIPFTININVIFYIYDDYLCFCVIIIIADVFKPILDLAISKRVTNTNKNTLLNGSNNFAKFFNIPIKNIFLDKDISKEAFQSKENFILNNSEHLDGLNFKDGLNLATKKLQYLNK